jgi:hypothetical protein
MLTNGQEFSGHKFLLPLRIDPASYPIGRPHWIALRVVAGDNSSRALAVTVRWGWCLMKALI